ncbi:uncharacterized protein [Rutidosis leptorrhynchoides]|uniref:uncharacterized protein n=1 Tax=Rutidosis leptorrhynchoides TaxID=125765 RepID=UPI003A99FFA4
MEDNYMDSSTIGNVDSKVKHDEHVLSAEDLAWADSLLNSDIEQSEINMDILKEDLLDILDQHSEFIAPSENVHVKSNGTKPPKNSPSVVDEETSINNNSEDEEVTDVLHSLKQQPFLPNYKDEVMNIQYLDDDSDDDAGFVLAQSVIEPLSDDIFKVWDLGIPAEEDELDKQLKEALSEDDAGTKVTKKKGLKLESLDSLIDSIADLSLK